jgi:hypothetical protein
MPYNPIELKLKKKLKIKFKLNNIKTVTGMAQIRA